VAEPGWWVCSPECRATLSLVWSGRRKRARQARTAPGEPPDIDLQRKERAARITERLPTRKVLAEARDLARGRRQHPRCGHNLGCASRATRYAWLPATASTRALAVDIHLLCNEHHLEFAASFVDSEGRIEHTAQATWARIEAAQPLVRRDNQDFFDAGRARLLTDWPLGDAGTRRDLERWVAELGREPAEAESDLLDRWNEVLDRLELPRSRRLRLVRAITALAAYGLTLSQRELREIGLKAGEGPESKALAHGDPSPSPAGENAV
jgi:hypothetical protein